MNCLEFRRAIGTDPRFLDGAAQAHRNACPRCNEAHERALQFERTLTTAVAIPVPDNLAERILLRQTTAALHEPRLPHARFWQIAAGLVVGVLLATSLGWRWFNRNADLSDLAVAHLAHEPFALSARAEVPSEDVRAMFASLGVPLRQGLGSVHYLNDCPLGGRVSVHMVMQRDSGPVTAMYVPKRHEPRHDFARAGVRGRESPIGDGTLVLLATNDRDFDAVETQFQYALAGTDAGAVGAP